MLGSVASSMFPSPVTPPYMSPWHSTPNPYMAMPQMMTEQDMSPLIAGMTGLGLSHMASPVPSGPHIPADLHTHQSRGTTYFTRKGQDNVVNEAARVNRFDPQSSVSSSHRAEDSLGQSSHASILSPIHSREASVETSATSNQAGSLDIKSVEDSGSDGKAEVSPLAGSVSSSSSAGAGGNETTPAQEGLTVDESYGERGRAATSEAVLRSPRLPQAGKKGPFMVSVLFLLNVCMKRLTEKPYAYGQVSNDGSPLRRQSGRRGVSHARMLSRSASATEVV